MRKSKPKPDRRLNRLAAGFLAGLWAVSPAWVNALPNGGEIVSGTGSIEQPSAQEMLIQQDSQRLITNWQGFGIGSAESVTFKQPNSSAVALNRVIGADPSIILGKLSANGQVFLTNPSGMVFGKDAVVDVHGLLATTLNISNKDFLKDNYQFSQDRDRSLAAVINNGVINATRYVGLAAPAVDNSGSIVVADLGSVALASGTAVTLDFNGDGLISFAVTGDVSGVVTDAREDDAHEDDAREDNAHEDDARENDAQAKRLKDGIHNSGFIRANGGQVLLTAKSAGRVIGDVVNHSGIIEAQTVQQVDGKIILSGGDPGTVRVSGTLDAAHVFVTADAVTVAAGNLSTNNQDINIAANDLDLKGDLDSGTGDVFFTVADGSDLDLKSGNSDGNMGGNDIGHIIAGNLILKTDGDINVQGITERNTSGISDSVILKSGGDITFEKAASTFPALNLMAVNDVNVNTDVTTTRTDFTAVADSENNGKGEFNVASGSVISSARDIDVSAPHINADESSFNQTRDLILNGSAAGGAPPIDANSVQQGSLGTFLTEFFENGGSGGC